MVVALSHQNFLEFVVTWNGGERERRNGQQDRIARSLPPSLRLKPYFKFLKWQILCNKALSKTVLFSSRLYNPHTICTVYFYKVASKIKRNHIVIPFWSAIYALYNFCMIFILLLLFLGIFIFYS